jgi:hypothetical protein
MRIGFCGAHRTGKTTLACELANRLKVPTVLSGTSAIVAKHGFDMGRDNRITHLGLPMQQEIQDKLIDDVESSGPNIVADRTPIDAAAYLLADATADRGDEHDWEEAMQMVGQALMATNGLFDAVIFVPPAIEFEPMDGKPPMNGLYQAHHSAIVRGLHADLLIPTMAIEVENQTVEGRVEACERFIYGLERLGTLMKAA